MFSNHCLMPLILSSLAGMSTVIGAFIVFFSKSKNKKLICFSLAFSAGVMISVSFTDLFSTAEETLRKSQGNLKGICYTILFLVIGAFIAMLIDMFIPEEPRLIASQRGNKLYRVGFVSMIALMIHNFPEGVATFVSGYENTTLGITIALAIALHNIPEGISIAMPIYYSTGSKLKAFKYTFVSGLAEPIGALLALLFLRPFINEIILAIIFAIVSGIMLYISFEELIPTARKYGYDKLYIFSIFLGICIIPLSHVLFN
ncbi:zinc transporter ZupT [Clostridium septicum]|uniref:Zinc transporter ZupT n=1 Tax=Clostridium septicum TaxID=1504 RepID=A0A9N7PLE7_CLOSE|nr:zinc transporter ZupT [Clostridium septicum]AYE35337.1 zinc transporter ZupT [Clostridium septicum]MDU1314849.1 zinc transporter ZupT [Clostridium septicum]QAS60728.1 zinc transporter ZupT [Clostridium septicum]UEC20007.1 zinc transporter ZupT [Clostridium septicum]USS01935.1 zinc transporter ZupT [Clostridium septicum]